MHAPSTPTADHATTVAPPLPLLTRFADYAMMTLAVALSAVSIAWLVWANRPILVPIELPAGRALWWNVLVSFVFFAQHSILVRRPVRARLAAIVPARYEGTFYAVTSGIALMVVVVLWQPAGEPLFVLHGVPRAAVGVIALLGVAGVAWSVLALPGFDMCGLRPVRDHLRGVPPAAADFRAKPFMVRGPYRWVRHPLYSSIILLLWADPRMSAGRLAIHATWTAWICLGAWLEERDLVAEFGEPYQRYRRRVPFLVPWRRPVEPLVHGPRA
jgi:protein-S-isoprenylcysteine O-methyltransferase Ste14